MLTKIDKNNIHLYSLIVNSWLWKLFMSQWGGIDHYHPALRECLGKMKYRLDIWTGNGVVSNEAAFALSTNTDLAKIDQFMKWNWNNTHMWKKHFVSCDLSKGSLISAKNRANTDFYNLKNLFIPTYETQKFQDFLKQKDDEKFPRLISAFNLVTNSTGKELNDMLQNIYNSMRTWDICLPSFFNMENESNKHSIYYNKSFRNLTKMLYNNIETREWCITWFCERYNIHERDVVFEADRDIWWWDFIDVNIYVPSETLLSIGEEKVAAADCSNKNNHIRKGMTQFNVFKSYRSKKEDLTKILESIWFGINGWMYTDDWFSMVPVLYKK